MKYRSRTEIVATILSAASEKVTKTKIMYKAYLSYAQVKEYLKFMLENELIQFEEGEQVYRITQKGFQFLHSYDEMTELVPPMVEGKLNFVKF